MAKSYDDIINNIIANINEGNKENAISLLEELKNNLRYGDRKDTGKELDLGELGKFPEFDF